MSDSGFADKIWDKVNHSSSGLQEIILGFNKWDFYDRVLIRYVRRLSYKEGYIQGFEDAQYSVGDWNKPL